MEAYCCNCIHSEMCQLDDWGDDCEFFKNKADFVEVVRCKDCAFFTTARSSNDETYSGCMMWGIDRPEPCKREGFCSYGERKEESCD